MKKKKNKPIVLILAGILFCISWYFMVNHSQQIEKSYERDNISFSSTSAFNAVDSILFKTLQLRNLNPQLTVSSDIRADLKEFIYNDKGYLFYTTIKMNSNRPLDEVIFVRNEEYEQTKKGLGIFGFFDLKIAQNTVLPVDSILCSLTVADNRMEEKIFNENFRSYYGDVYTFSLRYGENVASDISYRGWLPGEKKHPTPFIFAFYKKENTLFFIAYIPETNKLVLARDKAQKETFKEQVKNWFLGSSVQPVSYHDLPPDFLGDIINWEQE